jgi:uncharacterized GH25 family protein
MRLFPIILLIFLTGLLSGGNALGQSPGRELRGVLLNTDDKPVGSATIRLRAVTRDTGTRYGEIDDVDSSTITDANGEFVLRGKNPFLAATITAEVPGYAKGVFTELSTAGEIHRLTMFEGVTIIGAVVKNGQPVADVKIGLCNTDQGSKIFNLETTATTDAQGRFLFPNIPPKRDYYLFGYMHSVADKGGALPSRRVSAGMNGSILDLGNLNIEPAFVIEGHLSIQLPHIPVLLSRFRGRDAQTAETGALGQFHFSGVPGEVMILSVDAPGYRLSLHNASLNPSDPSHLVGRITTNKTDLLVELEPGPALGPLNISPAAAAEEPMRGAEPPTVGTNTFKITGQVTDAENGAKITSFVTSEGRLSERSYDWFFTRTHRHQDGEFSTYLTAGDRAPLLVVQSENHMPWVSGPITSSTNLIVKLKRGVHARGIVLKPDGQPATNVTVYLATPYGNTRIENFGVDNSAPKAVTDAGGHFDFPPQIGAVSVLVFDSAGFAEMPVDELLKTGEVRLKPLAKIEGTLLIGSAPGTNEVIYLATAPAPYHWYPLELPAYSITFTTRTDPNGNFVFDAVPPTLMEVAHSPAPSTSGAAPAGAFRLTQTQRLLPSPGETVRVTIGGKGREVTGRVEIAGYEGQIDWAGSPQTMETQVEYHGPSDAAMKSLTEKLGETQRPGTTAAQRKAAEDAYEKERGTLAAATQKYFASEQGTTALLATHRYFLQFDSEGAFHIEDVPPGKYRITGLIASNDPAAFSFARRFIAQIDAEVSIPEGKKPFNLGVIKTRPLPRPKAPAK